MIKKRLVLVAALALAALVVTGILISPEPESRLKVAEYYRVGPRMTLEQVEAILGKPGDYRTGLRSLEPVNVQVPSAVFQNDRAPPRVEAWHGDYVSFVVYFDSTGRSFRKAIVPAARSRPSTLEYLISRARRTWNGFFQ